MKNKKLNSWDSLINHNSYETQDLSQFPDSNSNNSSDTTNIIDDFGFEIKLVKTKKLVGDESHIGKIKYVRAKSPGEFVPADQDNCMWNDFYCCYLKE